MDTNETNEEGNKAIIHAFTTYQNAKDLQEIVSTFHEFLNVCGIPLETNSSELYARIKEKLHETNFYSPNALLRILDTKFDSECYQIAEKQREVKAVVVGAGIGGLRTAIEFAFMKLDVTVCEKRAFFARNNALHIWHSSIEDLKDIGVKFFYPKFCVGLINHVSIRQLQCAMLKVALFVGVKFTYNQEFVDIVPPASNETLWKVTTKSCSVDCGSEPSESQTAQESSELSCNVLIGADGEASHVCEVFGIERKVFQGARAIGITCNFENTNTAEDTKLEEFGVMSIYNQDFFADLAQKDIELENLVCYKDETHYFVMTVKKESLLKRGIVRENSNTTTELLAHHNLDVDKLKDFAREVGESCKLPSNSPIAKTPMGTEDIGIFDFSRKLISLHPEKFIEPPENNTPERILFGILVGDALVEPFWPLGTGANRAILSSLDAAWSVKGYIEGKDPEQVIQDANYVYETMQSASPDDLKPDFKHHTIDPHSRYIFKKINFSK